MLVLEHFVAISGTAMWVRCVQSHATQGIIHIITIALSKKKMYVIISLIILKQIYICRDVNTHNLTI